MVSIRSRIIKLIETYLDPPDRLSEVIMGILLVLTVTSSLRITQGRGSFSVYWLLVSALGATAAWGLVDAVTYIISGIFDRKRYARILSALRNGNNGPMVRAAVSDDLDRSIVRLMGPDAREKIIDDVMALSPGKVDTRTFDKEDFIGAIFIFLVAVSSAIPVILPFFLVVDPVLALGLSNLIAIAMMFSVGAQWAGYAGVNRWRTGLGFAVLGALIAYITVVLGG